MKTLITLLSALVVLAGVLSCNEGRTHRYQEVALSCDAVLNELNDSLLVAPNQFGLVEAGGLLYLPLGIDGMAVLDKDYRVKQRFSRRGTGPGELLYMDCFYVDGDSVYVYDPGRRSVEMFVDGKYHRSMRFPDGETVTHTTRFLVYGQRVYHSVVYADTPVLVFDGRAGGELRMCAYTDYDDHSMGRHGTRHVVKGEDGFFLIGCVHPILQYYSFEGRFRHTVDLTVVPEIARMRRVYETTPQDPRSYFVIVQDAYYHKGKLYLLIGCKDDSGFHRNRIAVWDVSGADWSHVATLQLPGEVYRSFCVGDSLLYAHNDLNSTVEVFRWDALR